MQNLTKLRLIYGSLSIVILGIEILIALFVRDAFIRPYGGDILVTLLLCCMVRSIVPEKIQWLPLLVFLFSLAVEVGQYFDFATLLGLSQNPVLRIALGSSFSVADILCYALGCFAFCLLERVVGKRLMKNENCHS